MVIVLAMLVLGGLVGVCCFLGVLTSMWSQ
jgi:hypothetical protein